MGKPDSKIKALSNLYYVADVEKCEHESGVPMIVFTEFASKELTEESLRDFFELSKARLNTNVSVLRICVNKGQNQLAKDLQKLGFGVDGIEYSIPLTQLRTEIAGSRSSLPVGYHIRRMEYDKDIDCVAAMEQRIHAADSSSRVNFETPIAIAGMKNYYRKSCEGGGAFVLIYQDEVVGIAGFMPDRQRPGALHVSSVGIDLKHQQKGLFFPLLVTCLSDERYGDYNNLTGVTTTDRLISFAKKYSIEMLGCSLSRLDFG